MVRLRSFSCVVLLIAGGLPGCASHFRSATCRPGLAPPFGDLVPEVGPRTPLTPDLSSITSLADVERTLGSPPEADQYRLLTARQCQCLAAAESSLGNLLERESQLAAPRGWCGHKLDRGIAALRDLLAIRAIDERNSAAAKALELYYLLAEAEYNGDILKRSLKEIDSAIVNYQQVQKQGLRLPVDEGTLVRQRLELCDRQAQVQGAIPQLNGQLCLLLGWDPGHGAP